MRVALFFDGKNHMKDLRRNTQDAWVDHDALARWTVDHVGGTQFVAAYYYTGVPNSSDNSSEKHALTDLLDSLERKPGFFVRRFNRRANTRQCPHCDRLIAYTEEKMVDTTLVADLITMGMRDAFDVAVVFSGDLDLAPALAAMHTLGKKCWIATFGQQGLSRTLVRQAWSVIDLHPHMDAFCFPDLSGPETQTIPRAAISSSPEAIDKEVLRELRRAVIHFEGGGGFVGAHYFIHRWKGPTMPESPEGRRDSLQRLMAAKLVELYQVDGKNAIRCAESDEDLDEETVEVRLSDAIQRLRAKINDPGP